MKSQQQAERAEQQRIKSLVLNYDLNDDQHDGEDPEPFHHVVLSPKRKRTRLVGKGNLNESLNPPRHRGYHGRTQHSTSLREQPAGVSCTAAALAAPYCETAFQDSLANVSGHIDHPHTQPRQDKSGNTRSKQRARKLQMGDIDWYDRAASLPEAPPSPEQAPLSDLIREAHVRHGSFKGARQQHAKNTD